ncbi:hypothetical protein CAPTEDRAFT_198769 [Capitella teleta]|uniref:G-protein coupled receptors family 1 profile domain-containing protein n=1 Tax=Capitella teleta TaxID=283909 RepID=R7VCB4_CAPTE|nr:hypothetical protein CAPTEDRAFT_198769 [Capitella teleta]|eukprot:ELU13325.1 hypothetical protein CAPTEDRAFT_198769 [Capitella teleta]
MELSNHTAAPTEEEPGDITLIPDWYVYFMVALYADSILVVPGNLMTVIAFFKYRLRQTTTNILICNQSIADLLVAITAQGFILTNYHPYGVRLAMKSKLICLFSLTGLMFSITSSVCNVALLTVERFLSIVMPIRSMKNKMRMALTFIIPSWIILLVINSVPLLGFNFWKPGHQCLTYVVSPAFYSYVIFQPMLLALVVIALLNFGIWRIARKQINRCKVKPAPKDVTPSGLLSEKQIKLNQKVTKMQLTLVGCFYIMYMPYICLTLLKSFPPVASWKLHGPPDVISILHEISKVLVGLNSALNPVIYAVRSPHFNKAFRSLLNQSPVPQLA